jgi:serine/threonine-protein kinase SRPK3
MKLSQHIANANPSHHGLHYVRTIIDAFEVIGPKGIHMCLVFKPLREPISIFQKRLVDGRYDLAALKATLRCLLFGLDYLHSQCHVIHTGECFLSEF